MKKITIQKAFEQNNLESIQKYIDIGFDFSTLSSEYEYLTLESMELLQKNTIQLQEKDILNSQDKRIFDVIFKKDTNIFYKIFYKIIYNNWIDYFEWDWDVKKVFENKMFADVVEVIVKNDNIEIFKKVQDKLIANKNTTYDTLKYLEKYRNCTIDEEYYTLAISKEKDILHSDDINDIIIDGKIDMIEDRVDEDPLYILIHHYLENEMNITAWDGVGKSISDKNADVFIKYFSTFKYDFDKNFKIQVYDRKAFKANGQSFWITPLIFLDKYITHRNKNKLIKKALEKSKNIFDNKIFRIARTYQRYNDEVLEYSTNYFDYFQSKSLQNIIFSKLNETEFNKIKHEKSKENLIKLALKRDDFDMKSFMKWGFAPNKEFIDFLIKKIGEKKTKEYGLINIDDLLKNKDWCLEQLLDENKSIIPKIDKAIISDIINDYSSADGANSSIANTLLKEHINYLLREEETYKWSYTQFHDKYLKVDKKIFWDDIINVIELSKPTSINFKTLHEIFRYCLIANPQKTKEKFETLSKVNQNKIKNISITPNWTNNEFSVYLVSFDKKILQKKDNILDFYVEKLQLDELKLSLNSGFEFKKSNGLFYYISKLFRTNNTFDSGYAKRFETDPKHSNYFDIHKANKIVAILLEYKFLNKKTLPTIMIGSGKSNIMETKNSIDFATMLIGHLIYFQQSQLLEIFKNTFKKEWKNIMVTQGFGSRKGNFMHYIIDNNIDDKKIIDLIKDDVDPNQTDRYKQTWEKFARKYSNI